MLMRYRGTDQVARVILVVKEGSKFIHTIQVKDTGVKLVKVKKREGKYMRELNPILGEPIATTGGLTDGFIRAGERLGITKEAMTALTEYKNKPEECANIL